jgi:hypothetical protein
MKMNTEIFMGFAQFGGMALVAGTLLFMQMKQDERTWNFMLELKKSLDELTEAIKGGIKK